MTEPKKRTVYGPVLSRRFGLSVGVDLMDRKVCSFDCLYCQVGRTVERTVSRADRVSNDIVLDDLRWTLEKGPRPDMITLAGSGEPTLHRSLPALLGGIRAATDVRIAVLTNGSLLFDEDVVRAVAGADILAPSLDAGDEETFARINRPHPEAAFDRLLRGLRNLSELFSGRIWLEVMLVRGVNDSKDSIGRIAERAAGFRLDGVDINTPVRPVPGQAATVCDPDRLEWAKRAFEEALATAGRTGARVRIISSPRGRPVATDEGGAPASDVRQRIRELLSRRPCTAGELSRALGVGEEQVFDELGPLVRDGTVVKRITETELFYCVPAE